MSSSYMGWRARSYDRWWGSYTARTLTVTLEMIDLEPLRQVPERLGRAPRVLDVGCGTGVLLRQLLERLPLLEAKGVDASADMLQQAQATLRAWPLVHLFQVEVGPGPQAGLPCVPGTFDLITCTNMLHYLAAPISTLTGLRQLLAPAGQLVLEDYARRGPPFPWRAFEWLVRRVDVGHVRAYTLAEAEGLALHAGLHVTSERAFPITGLWHGWALRTQVGCS
jgi:SAM-dependent methyltransferase